MDFDVFKKRIKKAILKESIQFLLGISSFPIPIEIIKEFFIYLNQKKPLFYVDWKLENWPFIYYKEFLYTLYFFYKGQKIFLPQKVIIQNCRNLNLNKIILKLYDSEPYQIPKNILAITESKFDKLLKFYRKNSKISNELNLKLIDINFYDNKLFLHTQPVFYLDYLRSNLMLDVKEKGKENTLRTLLHKDGKLENLKTSPLANHIGINILIFTIDGQLILQKRSTKVAVMKNTYAASVSGALSKLIMTKPEVALSDVETLEANEELGIYEKDIIEKIFLGLSREYIRGGEPEIFMVYYTNLTKSEILNRQKYAKDRWESKKILFFDFGTEVFKDFDKMTDIEKYKFYVKVDEFFDKYLKQASLPLLTNIAFWLNYKANECII